MKVKTGNHYLAFVLDDESRTKVIKTYNKNHDVMVCHHITVAYDFSESDVHRLQTLVDSNPTFTLCHFVTSETIDYFDVLVNGNTKRTSSSFTHLTFSRNKLAANVDSNKVILGKLVYKNKFPVFETITGYFKLIPKK